MRAGNRSGCFSWAPRRGGAGFPAGRPIPFVFKPSTPRWLWPLTRILPYRLRNPFGVGTFLAGCGNVSGVTHTGVVTLMGTGAPMSWVTSTM